MTAPAATRVVVADDSGLMRRVLAHALSDAGFDVVGQAADGDEALALCRRLRPDAMTLDLAMPGRDGIGVLRELRRPGAPPIPVIVVSAFSPAHGARAVDALSEGAFDLVAKPAAGETLSGFVSDLADKVRAAAGSMRRRIARPAVPPWREAAAAAPAGPARRAAAAVGTLDDGWSDSILAENTMSTRWFDGETELGGTPEWTHLWDQCFAAREQYEAHRRGESDAARVEAGLTARSAEVVYVPEEPHPG